MLPKANWRYFQAICLGCTLKVHLSFTLHFLTCEKPYQNKVLLASVHNILRGKAVDHIARVKNNQQKYHAKEEECLRPCPSPSNLVELEAHKQEHY